MAKKKTIRTIPQERTPMREQDAQARAKNFEEVACGYNLEEALRESERCLMCPDQPCVSGCPVSIDIPGFIQKINEKNLRGAYDILTDTNLLPSICGRVCPQENQCEGVCTVGDSLEAVAIGRLERFVGDTAIKEGWVNIPYIEPNRFRVGIVGSGPAGMACAADMAKAGCDVTVYEAFHQAGGVLKYGIPDFRLPNEVIDAEINNLKKLGVKFECNTLVGRLFTIEQMIDEMGFHAVFIGVGAGYPTMLNIPGDSSNGVLSANELLDALQPDARAGFPEFRHAAADRQARRRGRRGQHRDGRDAGVAAPGRGEGVLRLPPLAHRGAGARRGSASRRAGRAWNSTGSPLRSRCSTTARAMCAACAACAWNWASPTIPAGAARCRSPAANSISRPI